MMDLDSRVFTIYSIPFLSCSFSSSGTQRTIWQSRRKWTVLSKRVLTRWNDSGRKWTVQRNEIGMFWAKIDGHSHQGSTQRCSRGPPTIIWKYLSVLTLSSRSIDLLYVQNTIQSSPFGATILTPRTVQFDSGPSTLVLTPNNRPK